ncbi:hypothetical protein MHYP_G00015660, partial [Metynnis hypsauchen]
VHSFESTDKAAVTGGHSTVRRASPAHKRKLIRRKKKRMNEERRNMNHSQPSSESKTVSDGYPDFKRDRKGKDMHDLKADEERGKRRRSKSLDRLDNFCNFPPVTEAQMTYASSACEPNEVYPSAN